jgi:hypothetical protein
MASTDAKPVPQKNVAYRVTFPIYDADGDLVTGATGLDSEISKDAGTFTDCTNEATEIATSSGMYYLDLTSTEMNADTVAVIVKTSSSGAKTTPIILYPEEAGDIRVNVTQFGGTNGTFSSGRPEVNTTHLAGTSQTARDIGASVLLSSGTGTGQVTLTSGRVNADITHISAAAVSTSTAQLGVNVVNAAGTAWNSGAISASTLAADTLTAAKVAADVGTEIATAVWASGTRTLTAGTNIDGSTFTAIPWNSAWDAEVQSEVNDALLVHRLDELLNADSDIDGAAPPTVGSVFHELMTKTTGSFTYDQTTDSLEAIRDRGDAAWITATGFSTLDAAGVRSAVGLASANLDTQLTAIDDYLDTEVAAIKAKTDNLPTDPADASDIAASFSTVNTKLDTIDDFLDTEIAAIKAKTDNLPAAPAATSDIPSAATIADAVWDEALSGHLGAGSTGEALDNAGAAGDPWATSLPGAYGAGTAGKIVGDNLDATVSSRLASASYTAPLDAAGTRSAVGLASANLDTQLTAIDDYLDTEVAAIKAKTDNLPSDPADASDIAAAFAVTNGKIDAVDDFLDTEIAAIKAKTDQLTFTTANQVDATAATVSDKTGYRLSATGVDDVLDEAVEGSYTLRQYLRLFASALLGKVSGGATTTNTFRDTSDSKDRITATVDADGNRTTVTLDGS